MIIGALLFVVGAIYYLYPTAFHWIGRLPGDWSIQRDNFTFYFPMTTMIVFSLLFYLIRWIWQ